MDTFKNHNSEDRLQNIGKDPLTSASNLSGAANGIASFVSAGHNLQNSMNAMADTGFTAASNLSGAANGIASFVSAGHNLQNSMNAMADSISSVIESSKYLISNGIESLNNIRETKNPNFEYSNGYIDHLHNDYLTTRVIGSKIEQKIGELEEYIPIYYHVLQNYYYELESVNEVFNVNNISLSNEELSVYIEFTYKAKRQEYIEILSQLWELKQVHRLYQKKISEIKSRIKSYTNYKNRRSSFRNIISFIFKNLDDEEHDLVNNSFRLQLLKIDTNHEKKRYKKTYFHPK